VVGHRSSSSTVDPRGRRGPTTNSNLPDAPNRPLTTRQYPTKSGDHRRCPSPEPSDGGIIFSLSLSIFFARHRAHDNYARRSTLACIWGPIFIAWARTARPIRSRALRKSRRTGGVARAQPAARNGAGYQPAASGRRRPARGPTRQCPEKKTKKARVDGPVGGILAHPTEEGGSGEWAESGRELGRGRRKSAQGCSFSLVLFLSEFLFSLNILYFQIHVWFWFFWNSNMNATHKENANMYEKHILFI
jgi:hypothetical protein